MRRLSPRSTVRSPGCLAWHASSRWRSRRRSTTVVPPTASRGRSTERRSSGGRRSPTLPSTTVGGSASPAHWEPSFVRSIRKRPGRCAGRAAPRRSDGSRRHAGASHVHVSGWRRSKAIALARPVGSAVVLYRCLVPADGRPAFREAYGLIREGQLLRSRVLALFLCATLAVYGTHERMPRVVCEAVAALARTATG